MKKTALLLPLAFALTACFNTAKDSDAPRATAFHGVFSTSNEPAKQLFGAVKEPSQQAPESFGFYSKGCLAGGVELPETGPTWQAMRLSRNRNWGHPVLVGYIKRLSAKVARVPGWEAMLTGHASHQIGLDADIWMLPPSRLDLTAAERESLSSISTRRARGAYVGENWTRQHMEVLRLAASDPAVARIFVFPGAKVWMCNNATGDRSWLRKIRPWYGHHYHFHVRLSCPDGDRICKDQPPPPSGDGCADAQGWVDRILNPPPPDPDAKPKPPRAPLTLADLPSQCTSVLHSR